jgi:hypothetical protein
VKEQLPPSSSEDEAYEQRRERWEQPQVVRRGQRIYNLIDTKAPRRQRECADAHGYPDPEIRTL